MRKEFQRIAVVGRHEDARVAEPLTALVAHLTKSSIKVYAAEEMDLEIEATRVPEADLAGHVDLIITVGGDGTMLYAARLASDNNIPLLGINRGRLGFLADVTPDEMISSVDHVLHGRYNRESRLQLQATLRRQDNSQSSGIALNDVVLQRRETGRMVDFETRVGDHYVNTHAGDGLIVATPTGSTAYALSCGGPILEPQLDAIVIVPICPHTLTDRPIAIPAHQAIDVRLLYREDTKAAITVDGKSLGEIRPDDRLTISAADNRITLIHPPGYDFYGILRSKLFWGRDNRKRDNTEGTA
jgi:NAD+ kinase